MARIMISLPEHFKFSTELEVRITDLNYGAHLGNDRMLAFMQEARVKFLGSIGYSELDVQGVSLILADCAIVFKAECFSGDILLLEVAAGEFHKYGFNLFYRFTRIQDQKRVAEASSNMICFNYTDRKISPLPDEALLKLQNTN